MAKQELLTGVTGLFTTLSAIPHGSGQEGALADELTRHLAALGGTVRRDEAGNLCCDLPATTGRENLPLLCVQGHLDMVCAVKPGSGYQPERDGVTCVVEEGFLRSDGRSSLGADNLLGVSAALWLLESGLAHGPLRLLLTVQEEQGLKGALAVSHAWLDGVRYLVNVDGFQAGRCIVASAGGVRQKWTKRVALRDMALPAYRIALSGYPGGHSGDDIAKGRENPIRLLAALLAQADVEVASLSGGQALNAIPTGAEAVVCTARPEALLALLRAAVPEGQLTVEPVSGPVQVWDSWDRQAVLDFLLSVPIGVQGWRQDTPKVPAVSTNLGTARWEDGRFTAGLFLRGTPAVVLERAANGAALHGTRCGFEKNFESRYAPWEGRTDGPFARAVADCYRNLTGKEMEVTAVHVGLEPGALLRHHPEIQAVSIGATILDAHSVQERVPLEELPDFVRLLGRLMEAQ